MAHFHTIGLLKSILLVDTTRQCHDRFNTDTLCMKCAEEERQHPDYELAAVRAGNRNFAGLGWPGKNGRIKQ